MKKAKLLITGVMAIQAVFCLCLIIAAGAGLTFIIHELIKAW